MKAMILAAGRGERMMPLTANMPKPMLTLNGKPLLEYHLERLKHAGIDDIVINHAWCGDKIIQYFQDGKRFGVNIRYSDESTGALETAGGIVKALPLLAETANDVFWVVNGDVFCHFNFANVPELPDNYQGRLFLVANPNHNPEGDFSLAAGQAADQQVLVNKVPEINRDHIAQTYTFSGIAQYRASFFSELSHHNKLALGPLLRAAADKGQLLAEFISSAWTDVGTPERLKELEQTLSNTI